MMAFLVSEPFSLLNVGFNKREDVYIVVIRDVSVANHQWVAFDSKCRITGGDTNCANDINRLVR